LTLVIKLKIFICTCIKNKAYFNIICISITWLSHDSWIFIYLSNQCQSLKFLQVELDTSLYDKVCGWPTKINLFIFSNQKSG
jgi:hypothetical protein